MKKLAFEFCTAVVLFAGIWFSMSQINWVSIFHVAELNNKAEEKLGNLTWEFFKKNNKEINEDSINKTIDSLVLHLNKSNSFNHKFIKVHIIKTAEINAFALPNGHLVLNSQLIIDSKNQEELLGVIAHELAHIQLNHVVKKIAKEIGLAIVITAVTSNNSEVIADVVHTLTSSKFSRNDEKEADLTALIYLEKANIDPKPFANFLFRLSENEKIKSDKFLTLLSTHPDSKDRAKYIIANSKETKTKYVQVIKQETWEDLQKNLSDLN